MIPQEFKYAGDELDVFRIAVNWRKYWGSKIDQYLGNRVLEVGAGIGGTTQQLVNKPREFWLALEPDDAMVKYLISQKSQHERFPAWCEFRQGTVIDLPANELFDSILYIDVLEHIEDDQLELELAAHHLNASGYLIVLSPAYPFLFSEFDAAIGHHRRYTRKSFPALEHVGLSQIKTFFLDSVGIFTSVANKYILRSSLPSFKQIKFWDKNIIPISKVIDPLIRYAAGRSIVSIWQKR